MSNTPLSRISREKLGPELGAVWDTLNRLTGEPAFVEAFANAPELLIPTFADHHALAHSRFPMDMMRHG
jgi:hypothetical protein